jgi:hypothetical protein
MFNYEILESYVVLSNYLGITKEFNLIDYGSKEPLFDIRRWDRNPTAEREMLKGITLNRREMKILRDEINKLNLD